GAVPLANLGLYARRGALVRGGPPHPGADLRRAWRTGRGRRWPQPVPLESRPPRPRHAINGNAATAVRTIAASHDVGTGIAPPHWYTPASMTSNAPSTRS